MADPFVAEIRIFPGNFAPKGWAFCDGQLIPISQNTALFSLVGTTYGGDGQTTFALPDLQGRAPMHPGQGPGLSLRDLGETGGAETHTLIESELPVHAHQLGASTGLANQRFPVGNVYAVSPSGVPQFGTGAPVDMQPNSILPTGGSAPHNNMQPYLTLTFIIALQGIFPPRT